MLPFFTMANFPVTMRVATGAIIALLLAPVLPAFPLENLDFISVLGVMAQEVTVGLVLGFVSRMIFYAVDIAGSIISTEMGLNLAAIFDPLTQQSSQIAGTILTFLATVVMLSPELASLDAAGICPQAYTVLPMGGAHLNATRCSKTSSRRRAPFSWSRCKSPRRSWRCRLSSRSSSPC
jgi:flagellar biosynthetic protein FliR